MGLIDILCSSRFLFTLVEATSRSGAMWPLKLEMESTVTIGWTVFSSSIFMFVALVLSTYLIFQHLAAYNQPEEQKFLIGLILMVPVYALESFLSLLDSSAAFNCEVIRDCYEAFALYCFQRYLIACLGGEDKTIQFMESMSLTDSSTPLLKESYAYGVVEHPFPLNCFLRDWYLGTDFYQSVKIGIVQYMILKMICALLAMILQSFGVYGEGKFEWKYGCGCCISFFHGSISRVFGSRADNAYTRLYNLYRVPYKRGERCVRDVSVMADYASLGTPPDPAEVQDSESSTRMHLGRHDDMERRMKFTHNVRDVVFGSGEIIVDDMKFTVSHVVEPVERGIAKLTKAFHQISENVKRHEEERRRSTKVKDDSYLVPLSSWRPEFSDVHDAFVEGSFSDSGLPSRKRQHLP
ncbi:protein LAZ1 homolog 1 isoform X2 [Vigna angularis]|uniref:protein LAZ1 homolog 1 isoform X2 n=1 Tax=Phaseolus angularis TaxID=3914 RepID=UPI000809C9B3|nr:protein LAZ1 homolog 1 isoform X2 [Vigna angularis]